jgi:hypothetical protein
MGSVVLSPDGIAARWVFVELGDQVVKLGFGSHVSWHRLSLPGQALYAGALRRRLRTSG